MANTSGALRRAALTLAFASVLAGCGGGAPASRTIEVRMRYSKYLPASLSVKAGTTVDFVLVNTDPIEHEFILGAEAEQLLHEKGDPQDPHTGPGQAKIPANGTVRLSFTFARSGSLLYACHVPGHYAYGMRGRVTVT